MKNIILHSDDLGITEQSTKDIIDSWINGDITSFSIIANGDAAKKIPFYFDEYSDINARIAVHFNLTEGYPSSNPEELSFLTGGDGSFNQSFVKLLVKSLFLAPKKRSEFHRQLYLECCAQIEAVKKLSIKRDVYAIDSHNHIHMIPGVFASVAAAAKDSGIREIRISKEPFFINDVFDFFKLFWLVNSLKNLLLKIFSVNASKIAKNLKLNSPTAFIGLLYSGHMTAESALSGIRAVNSEGSIEVTFHIGKSLHHEKGRWINSLYSEFHLSPKREVERREVSKLSKLISSYNQQHSDAPSNKEPLSL